MILVLVYLLLPPSLFEEDEKNLSFNRARVLEKDDVLNTDAASELCLLDLDLCW